MFFKMKVPRDSFLIFLVVLSLISVSFVNSKTIIRRSGSRDVSSPFSVPDDEQSSPQRDRRSTSHSELRGMLSITNNFEVLRRRYLDNIKERALRQKKINNNQIAENQNFLDAVG
eukprot:GFUD01011622.1.p2 GENE.GFUD01011622.1~~GFUD01011622.1.p2  ORF type:complete len:115 (+),score=29.58 GFUD01011622.1:99-443(+)